MTKGKLRPEGTVAGLADTVKALRAELYDAMASAHGEELQFQVEKVTMEFAVTVTVDASASLGVRFWVLDLSGSGGGSRDKGNTVTLEMTPRNSDGSQPLISDDE